MQAVADALSLLANIVMAWNTSRMQAVLEHSSSRRRPVPPELIGHIAPTRLEGINLRRVFRFPVERYAAQLLPSPATPMTRTAREVNAGIPALPSQSRPNRNCCWIPYLRRPLAQIQPSPTAPDCTKNKTTPKSSSCSLPLDEGGRVVPFLE